METAVAIVVPVCVCVVLPIVVVWIVFNCIVNKTNKETEIILEAIKCNPAVDTQGLLDSLKKKDRSPWESLNRKLLRGCIFTLIGVTFALIASLVPIDQDDVAEIWIACGVSGSVGIGFLITYIVGYYNLMKPALLPETKKGGHH